MDSDRLAGRGGAVGWSPGGKPFVPAPGDEPATLRGSGSSGAESSYLITTLLDRLQSSLPRSEHAKLVTYRREAERAGSSHTAEWHRASRCARWAVQLASQQANAGRPAERRAAGEIVREIRVALDSEILDVESVLSGHGVSPRFEVELAWVEEAARLAELVAASRGWDAVPWESLLRELLNTSSEVPRNP